MIIKGSSRTGKGLGAYLMHDKNDRAELLGIRGYIPRDLAETLDDWRSDSLGTNCAKPLYHAQLNPDRALSRDEWAQALSIYEKEMGFTEQPRAVVMHRYKGREHLHVVYSRIDANGQAISDSWNYLRHEKAAREIEQALGLAITHGALYRREGPRPERTPDHAAHQQGDRLNTDPKAIAADGGAFVAALDAAGTSRKRRRSGNTRAKPTASPWRLAASFERGLLGVTVEQSGDAIHETSGGFGCINRAFSEERRVFAFIVIGNGFEVVGLREKNPKLGTKAGIVLRQTQKLRLNALVGF
jgi:hypothetical protein